MNFEKFNEKWKVFDDFLGKSANALIIIIIILFLIALSYKSIIGEQMMYQDYYDKHINEKTK